MDATLEGTGIDPAALERYVAEHIYSLPGTDRHREVFTVLLTGSRAVAAHEPASDVDVDVLCPQQVFDGVHAACLAEGIIKAPRSFFCVLEGDKWDRYYGRQFGRPHFSLTPLEQAQRQITEYEDVPLWVWTHARVLRDPGGQFRRILDRFHGYPPSLLHRKIKYRWMLAAYWEIECYPFHGRGSDALLPAGAAALNAVNELLRLFFLVEGRPFPYAEQLMRHGLETKLGKRFGGLLRRAVELVVGSAGEGLPARERLDRAVQSLCYCDQSPQADEFERACQQAMIGAGVDRRWVEADFQNIDELLSGELGPVP